MLGFQKNRYIDQIWCDIGGGVEFDVGIFDLIGIMKVLMVVNHTCMHVYGFLVSSEIKCFAKKVTSISSKKELGLEIGLISCSIDSRFKLLVPFQRTVSQSVIALKAFLQLT